MKTFFLVLLAGLFLSWLFFPSNGVFVRYSVDNRTELTLNGSVFSFIALNPDAVSKCASPVEQRDCFSPADYSLRQSNLTESQLDAFIEVVYDSDFFDLNDSYGSAGKYEQRSVQALEVTVGGKSKNVTLAKTPSGSPSPKQFQKVVDALYALKPK